MDLLSPRSFTLARSFRISMRVHATAAGHFFFLFFSLKFSLHFRFFFFFFFLFPKSLFLLLLSSFVKVWAILVCSFLSSLSPQKKKKNNKKTLPGPSLNLYRQKVQIRFPLHPPRCCHQSSYEENRKLRSRLTKGRREGNSMGAKGEVCEHQFVFASSSSFLCLICLICLHNFQPPAQGIF